MIRRHEWKPIITSFEATKSRCIHCNTTRFTQRLSTGHKARYITSMGERFEQAPACIHISEPA